MFVLKNAWKSVIRNRGRNILIAIIVAIIAATATVGLAIRTAASQVEEEGLQSTTVSATISLDRSKMISQAKSNSSDSSSEKPDFDSMREQLSQESLSLSDYTKYAKASTAAVSTYYSEQTSLDATDDFQPVESSDSASSSSDSSTSSDSSDSSQSANGEQGQGGMGGGMMGQMNSGDFTLTGFSSDTAIENASNGTFTMSSGKVFGYTSDSDGQVIISKALADFNDLEVGDTISVTKTIDDADQTYELTVSGIYKNTSSTSSSAQGPMGGTSQDADNQIYTSVSTLKKLGIDSEADNASDTGTQLNYTYVLGSDTDYETFKKDVKKAGLSSNYAVSSADVEAYESSLAPMKNLSSFTLTFLLIVLGVGAVILIVLNLFNVRERKYEVGVMTAIGVKKPKVAMQFVVELLIVTMVGLGFGVIGGAVASKPLSNQLLSSQVSSQQTEQASQQQQFGRDANVGDAPGASTSSGSSDSSTDSSESTQNGAPSAPSGNGAPGMTSKATDYISSLDATVNLKVVGELVLIGLALTLVSSLVGIIFVMRYEPLQILAERS